jgi:hypothetical protein
VYAEVRDWMPIVKRIPLVGMLSDLHIAIVTEEKHGVNKSFASTQLGCQYGSCLMLGITPRP